ncbi:Flp pilus assembly protein TadD, contains TPR repeats [Suttonella ornithocola]|uniref:Flp pilus assembly protein TadD, contains TPR repeats n=2 Tax=Suttonella ornithocola TaxID=279832 RepID=A0A380MM76_9GAMM|nr:Flp pilus assembly protein TadD, contains TPR repeats [Suttonella ornithocola]
MRVGTVVIGLLWLVANADEPPVALLPDKGSVGSEEALLRSAAQQVQQATPPVLTNISSTASANQTPPPWSGYKAAESLATNGNPELALKQLEGRLVSAPNDAKAAYLKGLILMQLGRSEDAERWFKMMQSNFPNLPQPYNALAVIYTGRGDLLSAENTLQALLAQNPNHRSAHINLANIYLKLAQENYQKALDLNPKDAAVAQKLKALEALN